MDDCGRIHVYLGSGKEKTTAALALVLRALGYGARVALIQFMKGSTYSGGGPCRKKSLNRHTI